MLTITAFIVSHMFVITAILTTRNIIFYVDYILVLFMIRQMIDCQLTFHKALAGDLRPAPITATCVGVCKFSGENMTLPCSVCLY